MIWLNRTLENSGSWFKWGVPFHHSCVKKINLAESGSNVFQTVTLSFMHGTKNSHYLSKINIDLETYPFRKMVRSCILSEVFRIVEQVRKQQLAPKPVFLVSGRREIQRNARWHFQAFWGTVVKFLNPSFWILRYFKIVTLVFYKVLKSNWRKRSKMNIFRFIEDDQMEAWTTT